MWNQILDFIPIQFFFPAPLVQPIQIFLIDLFKFFFPLRLFDLYAFFPMSHILQKQRRNIFWFSDQTWAKMTASTATPVFPISEQNDGFDFDPQMYYAQVLFITFFLYFFVVVLHDSILPYDACFFPDSGRSSESWMLWNPKAATVH